MVVYLDELREGSTELSAQLRVLCSKLTLLCAHPVNQGATNLVFRKQVGTTLSGHIVKRFFLDPIGLCLGEPLV